MTGPEYTPDCWEEVHYASGRSHNAWSPETLRWVCRVCGELKPGHKSHCFVPALEARLAALKALLAAARALVEDGRPSAVNAVVRAVMELDATQGGSDA